MEKKKQIVRNQLTDLANRLVHENVHLVCPNDNYRLSYVHHEIYRVVCDRIHHRNPPLSNENQSQLCESTVSKTFENKQVLIHEICLIYHENKNMLAWRFGEPHKNFFFFFFVLNRRKNNIQKLSKKKKWQNLNLK